jgi:hypothetical protein
MSPAESRGKLDWLRSNPTGVQAQAVRRELRAWERDLEAQGLTVEDWLDDHSTPSPPGPLTRGWVAFWPNRPGKPLASIVYHSDRNCQYIRDIPAHEIREARPEELERLPLCGGRDCGG